MFLGSLNAIALLYRRLPKLRNLIISARLIKMKEALPPKFCRCIKSWFNCWTLIMTKSKNKKKKDATAKQNAKQNAGNAVAKKAKNGGKKK